MQKIQVVKKQSRYSKGIMIAASRKILKVQNEDAWLVESETTDDKFYKVTENGSCDCMDFQNRGGPCKHMWALIRRGQSRNTGPRTQDLQSYSNRANISNQKPV